MSDPHRPTGPGSEPSQWSQQQPPLGNQYPPVDPAYAGNYGYPASTPPSRPEPTRVLPPYWTQTQHPEYPQYQQAPQPPDSPPPPKTPRWLWFAAGAALVLVVGLVAALVIANGSDRDDTVVAPLPPKPDTTSSLPTTTRTTPSLPTTTAPPTTTSIPGTAAPQPPITSPPDAAATESVVYSVSGEGRAISITYVDTGGVLQMEFNVVLPWTREVALTPATVKAASVTVINVGREVSCTVSVNGAQIQTRSGNGLTICAGQRR